MAKKGFISPYRHYNFVDKDPIIDLARTAVERSSKNYKTIHEESGVSTATLYNWFHGKVKRPRFSTAAEVLLTCGVDTISLRALLRRKNGK